MGLFKQRTKLDPNRFNFRGGRKKFFPLHSDRTELNPIRFIPITLTSGLLSCSLVTVCLHNDYRGQWVVRCELNWMVVFCGLNSIRTTFGTVQTHRVELDWVEP